MLSSTKPLPTLSDMPWNIKKGIVNHTDALTRISLRKCARDLREIIDTSPVTYPLITIDIGLGRVSIAMSSPGIFRSLVTYSEVSEDSCIVRNKRKGETLVSGKHHFDRAVSDLAAILKNPRCNVTCLTIGHLPNNQVWRDRTILLSCLRDVLEKLPHQLSVLKLCLNYPATQDGVLHMLPFFKPGTLKSLAIENQTGDVRKLVKKEQWKMAERVELRAESNVRIQDLLHLVSFDIHNYRLKAEEIPLLIQAFVSRNNESSCYRIRFPDDYDVEPMSTWLNDNEATINDADPELWHFEIPGAEFHLDIYLGDITFVMSASL